MSAGRARPVLPPAPTAGRTLRIVVVAAALALAVAVWFVLRPGPDSAEKDAALKLAREGRPAEAAPALRAYLDRHPDDPDVLAALVAVLIREGRLATEVEPPLDRLCAVRPNDPNSFRLRLDLRRKIGDRDGALADGQRVLELAPDDQDTRQAVAVLAVDLGRTELAEREIATLLAARPGDRVPLGTLLARAYLDAGDFPRAEAALNDHVPAGVDFAPARVIRGVLDYEAGRYERAEAILRSPAAADTTEGKFAAYYYARALVQLGRTDEAKAVFDWLGAGYRADRLTTDAAQRRDDRAAQVRAAKANLEVGKAAEAVRLLEAVIARLGPDREALEVLAACYEKLGRPADAAAARTKASSVPGR